MDHQKGILYIVVPCYNEEKVLPVTAPLFLEELQTLITKQKISAGSRILFVDDGSTDHTWDLRVRRGQCMLLWYPPEQKPRASECCAGRTDGSKRFGGFYHFHRLRRSG